MSIRDMTYAFFSSPVAWNVLFHQLRAQKLCEFHPTYYGGSHHSLLDKLSILHRFSETSLKKRWLLSINRVATKFDRQNSRIIQGCLKDLLVIFKDAKTLRKCRVAAPIREISARCITLSAKFKDFKEVFQNSRTFQVS